MSEKLLPKLFGVGRRVLGKVEAKAEIEVQTPNIKHPTTWTSVLYMSKLFGVGRRVLGKVEAKAEIEVQTPNIKHPTTWKYVI